MNKTNKMMQQLMHRPDEGSRMVLYTARKVAAGEEFSLAYFDLAEPKYMDVRRGGLI